MEIIRPLCWVAAQLSIWIALGASAAEYSPGAPGQMIEISATIYDFRYDKETQFGVFYQYNRDHGSLADSNVFLQGTQEVAGDPIPALDLSGNFAKMDYGTIEYNIKAALQEGWGTVISNPSILTADGKSSSIISGEVIPITEVTLQGNKTNLQSVNRDTGIKLIVTPHIYKGDNVLMKLEIESSEITRFEIFDRGDGMRFELPVLARRNIKSVVIIPNEKKLYIGGLYTDISGDVVRKIPVLGDVPGLGFFLRGFNKRKSRAETVFQITPIIRDPGFGITSQDVSIFSDLLEPEGDEEIINQYQMLDQVSRQQGAGIDGATGEVSLPANGGIGGPTGEIRPSGEENRESERPDRKPVKRFRLN